MIRNKSILDVREKLHQTYNKMTSKTAVVFPSERRGAGVKMSNKTPYQKRYTVSKQPRSL